MKTLLKRALIICRAHRVAQDQEPQTRKLILVMR